MLENVIKKLFPIRDEKGRPCTFPTFGSQVFGEDEEKRALWQDDKGFYADDSKTLGGKEPKYYIQPRNLLDNSDFTKPVNRRGGTSGAVSDWAYFIDRWRGGNALEYELTTNGIRIVKGSIVQSLSSEAKKNGKTYTFAACLSTGSVRTVTYALPTSVPEGWTVFADTGSEYSDMRLEVGGDAENYNVFIHSNAGDVIVWAALYEGEYTADTLPPYVSKGHAAELAECRRYLRRFKGDPAMIGYVGTSANTVYVVFDDYEEMRDPETVGATVTGGTVELVQNGTYYSATLTGATITYYQRQLNLTYTGATPVVKTPCIVCLPDPIWISKEL